MGRTVTVHLTDQELDLCRQIADANDLGVSTIYHLLIRDGLGLKLPEWADGIDWAPDLSDATCQIV